MADLMTSLLQQQQAASQKAALALEQQAQTVQEQATAGQNLAAAQLRIDTQATDQKATAEAKLQQFLTSNNVEGNIARLMADHNAQIGAMLDKRQRIQEGESTLNPLRALAFAFAKPDLQAEEALAAKYAQEDSQKIAEIKASVDNSKALYDSAKIAFDAQGKADQLALVTATAESTAAKFKAIADAAQVAKWEGIHKLTAQDLSSISAQHQLELSRRADSRQQQIFELTLQDKKDKELGNEYVAKALSGMDPAVVQIMIKGDKIDKEAYVGLAATGKRMMDAEKRGDKSVQMIGRNSLEASNILLRNSYLASPLVQKIAGELNQQITAEIYRLAGAVPGTQLHDNVIKQHLEVATQRVVNAYNEEANKGAQGNTTLYSMPSYDDIQSLPQLAGLGITSDLSAYAKTGNIKRADLNQVILNRIHQAGVSGDAKAVDQLTMELNQFGAAISHVNNTMYSPGKLGLPEQKGLWVDIGGVAVNTSNPTNLKQAILRAGASERFLKYLPTPTSATFSAWEK